MAALWPRGELVQFGALHWSAQDGARELNMTWNVSYNNIGVVCVCQGCCAECYVDIYECISYVRRSFPCTYVQHLKRLRAHVLKGRNSGALNAWLRYSTWSSIATVKFRMSEEQAWL